MHDDVWGILLKAAVQGRTRRHSTADQRERSALTQADNVTHHYQATVNIMRERFPAPRLSRQHRAAHAPRVADDSALLDGFPNVGVALRVSSRLSPVTERSAGEKRGTRFALEATSTTSRRPGPSWTIFRWRRVRNEGKRIAMPPSARRLRREPRVGNIG